MSKNRGAAAKNAAEAFHKATMQVYADLEALIRLLCQEWSTDTGLMVLDLEAGPTCGPSVGDSPLIANIKTLAWRVRASASTAQAILRRASGSIRFPACGYTIGGLSSTSVHETLLAAADELLQPDAANESGSPRRPRHQSASGTMRRQIFHDLADPTARRALPDILKHEYQNVRLLMPEDPTPVTPPPTASLRMPHPVIAPSAHTPPDPEPLADTAARGFHLLRHLKGFLCRPADLAIDDQRRKALQELTATATDWSMKWPTEYSPLLHAAKASISDRQALTAVLTDKDIQREELACLARIAASYAAKISDEASLANELRTALASWQSLLPLITTTPSSFRLLSFWLKKTSFSASAWVYFTP